MLPIERLKHERQSAAPASAENDRADRNAFAFFKIRIEHRIIATRCSESTVGMRGFLLGIGRPIATAPIDGVFRSRPVGIFAFPPNVAVIGQRDIGIKRIVLDRFHRVRIRFVIGSRHDAEIAVLGIDREQAAIAHLHPGDVVADRSDFPAGEMFRRNEHREIGFAARARESGRDVMFSALRRLHSQNQHVFRKPPLLTGQVGTDPQRQAFLAEQNVAPIAGAYRHNLVVLWKMTDEPPLRIYI